MRGNIGDSLLMVAIIVSLFFTGMVSLYMWGQFQTPLQAKLRAQADDPAVIDDIFDGLTSARTAAGKGVMFVIIALMAVTLALAYLIPAHPILIVITVIAGAVAVILSVVGKTIMDAAFNVLPALASQIPGTTWFWNNITVLMSVYVAALALLMYYGWSQGGMG